MTGRAVAAAGGMILFALCAHHGLPWTVVAAAGLLTAALAISGATDKVPVTRGASPGEAFGLGRVSLTTVAYTVIGLGLGVGAGMWHRHSLDLPLLPRAGIQPFVLVACLIGAAEELLYRGWLLGQLRSRGWPIAIASAAVAHAAYKTALFAWPATPAPIDLWALFWITTVAGAVLGLLRRSSNSVIPAIAAHAAFDFVVYGAVGSAPWWVWS